MERNCLFKLTVSNPFSALVLLYCMYPIRVIVVRFEVLVLEGLVIRMCCDRIMHTTVLVGDETTL